jgi:hypothetical protein
MTNSREAFEKAVAGKWPDSYTFTQFNGNKDYRDEVLQGMWVGWQASRQALECEPVAWIVHCPSGYKKRPHAVLRSDYNVEDPEFWVGGKPPSDATVTRLYTHPASVDVFEGEPVGVVVHRTDPRSDNPDAYIDWTFGGDIENLPDGMKLYGGSKDA